MEINYARLHSSTFAPGLGNIKETLDKTQFSKLSMTYADGVLKVTATKGKDPEVTFLVPLAAVALMTASKAG